MSREELNRIRDDLFCEFCGKQCKSLNSLNQHSTRCSKNPDRKDFDKLGNYSKSIKGKTKYSEERIKKSAQALRDKYANGYVSPLKGIEGFFKGKHHTAETKKRLSEVGKYNATNHINGWKAGTSKRQNRYEQFTKEFLDAHNITYQEEFIVSTHRQGSKGVAAYYQLDFLINNKIDLELDGTGHNFDNDSVRDDFISKEYQIYRIQHNDSIDTLQRELKKFICTIT